MTSMRESWGTTLVSLGAEHENLVVVDGDLATSTKAVEFANAYPDRFVEVGIDEQNLVGIAVGMSTLGFVPWLSSFGVFFSQRALDQIRMLVSQTKANVKIGASYAGLLNGSSGKSHQDIEDIAIMRGLPNMTVIAPADANEAKAATEWATEYDGPVYLRLARDSAEDVFTDQRHRFVLGEPEVLLGGHHDTVLISTGIQTSRTLQASSLLANRGIQVGIIHLPTLKPLNEEALLQAVGDATNVITVEEHSIYGGLGGIVCEAIASQAPGKRVTRLGLNDEWSQSGPNDFLLDHYGLSPIKVAEQVYGILHH